MNVIRNGLDSVKKRGQLIHQRRPSFDFLTLHYMYIITMTLLGSLLIFAGGEIRYIDSLFMSSSSCTQAGLATVNINDLNTYQQVVMFFLAGLTNPIVIHSATAFVRLYWFQKRFAHIVKEINHRNNLRRSKSKAQSMELEERGVAGREIRVLFDSGRNQQVYSGHERNGSVPDPMIDQDMRRQRSMSAVGDRISFSSLPQRQQTISRKDSYVSLIAPNEEINSTTDENLSGSSGSKVTDSSASEQELRHSETHDQHIKFLGKRSPSIRSQAIVDDDDEAEIDKEESIQDEQQRAQMDIRFADLPVPRKANNDESSHVRSGSVALPNRSSGDASLFRARTADPGTRSIGSALLEFGQRTMTMDGGTRNNRIHRRRASSVSRPAGRSTTIERTITTAFRRRRDSSPSGRSTKVREMTLPYISFQPTIGRNSAFMSLSKEQRAELGGIEYRATRALCWVLVFYFFGFHVFGFICYIAFIYSAQQYIPAVISSGVSRGWWSLFTSASAFNDLGLTLTPTSFIPFQNAAFLLLLTSFLIVIGNTGFPCMIRFVIWFLYRLWPSDSPVKEEFAFLLDHPRRCFTLLFPSTATWWLFAVLIGLNGLDLLLFIILDLGNDEITAIPVGYRIVDGLFQAFCTRTAGFTAVNLAGLHSAILVSYMIMM